MKKIRKLRILTAWLLLAALLAGPLPARATEDSRYDPALEGIVSGYYPMDREQGFLLGVAPGTDAQRLQATCLPAGLEVSGEQAVTGTMITNLSAGGEQSPFDSLTVIVTGDLNGDGAVTITDMLMIKSSILGETLADAAAAAGDLNFDGNVSISDFLKAKAFLLGLEGIALPTGGEKESMLLLQPGQTAVWNVAAELGTVTFASDSDAVAAVDETGAVTAGEGEGSTFLYALDGEGNVLQRQLVTVLSEPLGVSLDVPGQRLMEGKSMQLTARVNHPVPAAVSWSSSDSSVATVDGGTVTGVKMGEAVITASLENGSSAQVEITVAPPVTGMQFEKSLYKIRPDSPRQLKVTLEPAGVQEELLWSSSNPKVATVDSTGTVTGVKFGTATITAKGRYSGLSTSCTVKICDAKYVAITFDDGPSEHTPQLLDYCKENDIKVTFFMVGSRLSAFPDTVKRQAAEGHELGYHSYAHAMQTSLSTEKIQSDFTRSNKILKELTGQEFTLWRTPGGDYSDRVLKSLKLPHIMWSVDSRDWESQSADAVYREIMRSSKDGSIILVHDLYSPSVRGAIAAMKDMNAGDFEFMTVTELLSRNGTPPKASTNYYSG